MFDLIVSQGRIADRSARTIDGAARTADALGQLYGITGYIIGRAAPPADDDWRVSLPQAQATLVGLGRAVAASLERRALPLVVANTCSASLATLPVMARAHPSAVVLWIDAHGDFNTPSTTSTGYLGGMVLSAACGLWDSGHDAGLRPEQIILVGARDIDEAEGELLANAGVRIIAPADATPQAVLDAVDGAPVWVHIDWDVLEPGFVPADYHVSGGLFPAQLRTILQAIPPAEIAGIEVAEFNAPADDSARAAALAIILDVLSPLLDDVLAGSRRRSAAGRS